MKGMKRAAFLGLLVASLGLMTLPASSWGQYYPAPPHEPQSKTWNQYFAAPTSGYPPPPPAADVETQAISPREEGGIRLGPLRVHPGVMVSETFTDNYFLDPDDRRSEWITTISPNLALHLPMGRHSVDLDYRSDFYLNTRYGEFNDDHHVVNPRFTLDFPGGLIIKGGHRFVRASNPPVTPLDDLKGFSENISTLEVQYRFSDRYSVAGIYSHGFRVFEKDRFDADDFVKDDVALYLNYRLLPKTSFFVEAGWTGTEYPHRPFFSTDNDLYRIWVGVRTKPTAKIVGVLKGGWNYKVFDEDRNDDHIATWGLQGDLYYDITPATRLSLVVFRRIEDTQITTTRNVLFGSTYDTTGGILEARHRFSPKVDAYALAALNYDEYNDEGIFGKKRHEWRFQGALGVDYRFRRWLAVGLNYRFVNNDSNFSLEDYTENRFMVYASLVF